MERLYTQLKRPRNAACFKEKLMIAKAQEVGQISDEEQIAFLADPGISKAPVAQQKILQNSSFQTDDLDAYDLDSDDFSSAKAVLMANLSRCDLKVLPEDTNPSTPNDLLMLSLFEQMTDHIAHLDKENQTNKMAAVDQCSVDKNIFEIQIKQLRIDNDQLMNKIMSQEIMHIVANSMDILDVKKSCVNDCTQSQEKDIIIRKFKEIIKSLSGKDSVKNVKKDIDEIKTINIELEHRVAKLLLENKNLKKEREHLESIYKDQFDSIRKIRVQSKEHCDSIISQINAKSIENSDLNAQVQEKVFAITALKNELRKLKWKNVVNTVVSKPNATLAPGMFKLDIEPISPRLKNNRDAH
nr:hypothetical protein [Tanacetum cinerariifolium]